MKGMIVTTIALLHKYKRFWIVNLTLVASLGLAFASFLPDCFDLVYGSIFLLVMAAWEISDVFLFEKRAIIEEELANEKDKLILAEHDVERLKLELEVTQSALNEAKRRKEYSGYVQTGLAQVEAESKTASIDTAETAVADAASTDFPKTKPRPKRRPAPKRKPKQTENVNENQN